MGFLQTPNLLENRLLIPYPNAELTTLCTKEVIFSDQELDDLQKQKYLGKRVELFFKKWLEIQPYNKIVAHGLQVINNKTTIGEFDFLYLSKQDYVHTELVYKQYIYIPSFGKNSINSWVGPNKKDFLYLKLEKLYRKQFPLLYNKLSIDLMKANFLLDVNSFQQKICFKAQLYLHFNEVKYDFYGISSSAIVGKWYYFKEFKQQDFENQFFLYIYKQDWPVLPCFEEEQEWRSFSLIIQDLLPFMKDKRSVKLWRKTKQEIHQLFVIWEEEGAT